VVCQCAPPSPRTVARALMLRRSFLGRSHFVTGQQHIDLVHAIGRLPQRLVSPQCDELHDHYTPF
jgi:hypothetical protein